MRTRGATGVWRGRGREKTASVAPPARVPSPPASPGAATSRPLMSLPAALTYLPFLPPTELGSIQQIIYGLAMVLLMMFRPGGLVGGRSKEKSA